MSEQPIDVSDDEARTLLAQSEQQLLVALGESLTGPQAFAMHPTELVERATRWLTAQKRELQRTVCVHPAAVALRTGNDDVAIVVELAKLLVGLMLPVNPVTLAVLIVKKTLSKFCESA